MRVDRAERRRYLDRTVKRPLPICLLASCSTYYPETGPVAGVLPDVGAAVNDRFRSLADAYLSWHYAAKPTAATFAGIHDFDGSLGRHGRTDLEARGDVFRSYRRRLARIDARALNDEEYYDYRVLESHLHPRPTAHRLTDEMCASNTRRI